MHDRINGKAGEILRWILGLGLAGLVSYYTALGAIQSDIAAMKATEESHFGEVLRRMDVMQQDLREIRERQR